ncbi:hypothetical protein [Methylophaga sp. OBS3]|uniref:hypothetical protein n=1 Tax=Methylophaga sp. OBS3 TaxID=2991934 RepID=UPI0022581D79|nr:hypothetical protein [Methylophaga sp. OBS3]MCX4190280.1 hypothetical protein [Methylophaga sp. OBS3]
MKNNLKARIKLKAPLLCKGDKLPNIFCGDGWYQLISEMMDLLEPMAHDVKKQYCKEPRLYSIEPSKGSMKVIIDDIDMAMDNVIEQYEDKSGSICETCGEPGIANGIGWIEVLCKHCAKAAGR